MEIIINNYEKLKETIIKWQQTNIPFILIHSRGGVGKTSLLKEILSTSKRITSHTTPLALYQLAYNNKEKTLFFDDVDNLLSNSLNVSLLKQLTDTQPIREINYYSTSGVMDLNDLPPSFVFSGRVVITLNDYKPIDKNVKALDDRGLIIFFNPKNDELLLQLEINHLNLDKEVYNFLFEKKDLLGDYSFRTYLKACELKILGYDWKDYLLNSDDLTKKEKLFLKLEEDYKGEKISVKVLMWTEFYSRRSYFYTKNKLKKKGFSAKVQRCSKNASVGDC